MGTWGTGIFDDDVAQDVKIAFEEYLRNGDTVAAASQRILDCPPWNLDDEEDAAVFYMALASLQLEHGYVDSDVRERAISLIDSGVPLWRWEDTDQERLTERTVVLERLRSQLTG